MRYFDTITHTETHKESETTIPQSDERVKGFFSPLKEGYRIKYINDLPVIEFIPEKTQEEIDVIEAKQAEEQEWSEYLAAEKIDKKDKWIKDGKPKYSIK